MESSLKLCMVCNRLTMLRCICCDTAYCSGECKLKDWDSHHASSTPNKKEEEKALEVKPNKKPEFKREKFYETDSNSLAYKLMYPSFPEHVKKGLKISVQERLAKTKEKLNSSAELDDSGSSGETLNHKEIVEHITPTENDTNGLSFFWGDVN